MEMLVSICIPSSQNKNLLILCILRSFLKKQSSGFAALLLGNRVMEVYKNHQHRTGAYAFPCPDSAASSSSRFARSSHPAELNGRLRFFYSHSEANIPY